MPLSSYLSRLAPLAAIACLGLPASSLHAQTDAQWVSERMDAWYRTSLRAAPGEWGIAIADQAGRPLWSMNPDQALMPASTVKLFTTGFARSVLGGTARRPTRVVGAGSLDSATGAWIGSWALEVNGDPSLERAEGSGPTLYDLALQLASGGVRRLTGPLQLQSSNGPANALYPAVWSSRHQGRIFAPLVGPLTLHENIVWITVRPGARVGQRVRLIETAPAGIGSLVSVTATTRSGRRSRLSLRPRADGGWVLGGTLGVRASPRRLTAVARDPRAVLSAVWGGALKRAGIAWNPSPYLGSPPSGGPQILAEVSSPPLDSLASEINRRSLNLGAELLLQWAGGRDQAPALLTDHVRQVVGSDNGVYLVDGSGLSYEDRVTPKAFVTYLAKFPATPAGRNFPMLLPANGTGTLHRLNSGFPGVGVVRAKTGTLGRVSTVVGYLGRPEGTLLVALMYNGSRPWAARQAQWKLFRELGANGVVIPTDTLPEPPVQLGGEQAPPAPTWWPADPAQMDSTEHSVVAQDSIASTR
ncbi:MAG TPA: D-alanyl-D-alanine carboxypeptidase/D-alanyl-D-alanine-endopeptidase [Gemmatimonadales bacterium]|nr:D-alanyl-D-alanine carboxypeptidase/D-alanyl-D-alanine-endopeptidase [Gemmatimonadales bacterium]